MKESEVNIDREQIGDFFANQLVMRGYVPAEEELGELADITFDYLIDKCIIDEQDEE